MLIMAVLAGKLPAKWIRQNRTTTTGIIYKMSLKTVITQYVNLIEISFEYVKPHF